VALGVCLESLGVCLQAFAVVLSLGPLCGVLHVYTHTQSLAASYMCVCTHTHTQSLAVSSALVDGGSPSLKLPSDQEGTLIGRRSARFIEI
jgi:hypothetical protein